MYTDVLSLQGYYYESIQLRTLVCDIMRSFTVFDDIVLFRSRPISSREFLSTAMFLGGSSLHMPAVRYRES